MLINRRSWCFRLLPLLLLFLIGTLIASGAEAHAVGRTLAGLDRSGQRILIVAPHPDDEALGAAGLVQEFLRAGSEVWVALATNGDANQSAARAWFNTRNVSPAQWVEYGQERQRESLAAAKGLGLSPERVIFLGYPDSGVDDLWHPHWDKDNPWTSPFTRVNKNPYALSHARGASYTGEAAWQDFVAIFAEIQPTLVLIPHLADTHQDHWATGAFATTALEAWRLAGEPWAREALAYQYLVHWPNWPRPAGVNTNMSLLLPLGLEETNAWERLSVAPVDRLVKSEVINLYKTQTPNESSLAYLLSFSRAEELFAVPRIHQTPFSASVPSAGTPKPGTPTAISMKTDSTNVLHITLALHGQPPSKANWQLHFYGIEPTSAIRGNLSVVNISIHPGQQAKGQVAGLYAKDADVDVSVHDFRVERRGSVWELTLQLPLNKPLGTTFLFSVDTFDGERLSGSTPYTLICSGED